MPSGSVAAGPKHDQYRIAKVVSAEAMKKKKGSIVVELDLGSDTTTAVTTYQNVEEGQIVIIAPEGSTVSGKEVKKVKVAGEWAASVLCGPMEMGWPGDASSCIVLDHTFTVGDFAPAGPVGADASAAAHRPEAHTPKDHDIARGDEGQSKSEKPQNRETEREVPKMDDGSDDDGRRSKKKGKRK